MTGGSVRPANPRSRLLYPVVGVGISVVGLWLALRGVDVGATATILARADVAPLALVGVVLVAQLALRSVRWSLLLPTSPAGRVPARRLAPAILVGYLGNAVLPARLGDALRAVLVGRRESLPVSGALGSVVLERLLDTLTLGVIVVPAMVLAGAPAALAAAAFVAVSLAGSLLLVARTGLPARMIGRLRSRSSTAGRAGPWLDRAELFAAAIGSRGRGRALIGAMLLSAGAWLLDGAIYWLAANALGLGLSPAGAMLVSAVTVLGTAIPSAPGYLGTFELAASLVARQLGVAPDGALALAVLAHSLTVLPLAVAGLGAVLWMRLPFRPSVPERASLPPDTGGRPDPGARPEPVAR